MPVNLSWGGRGIEPPDHVEPASRAPAVYQHLAAMPDAKVIAEFPFGDPAWELRYVYYSTVHWKPIVNGYSGGFPQGYQARVAVLQRVDQRPDEAWRALRDAGTTHVVVHEGAFAPGEADAVKGWLDNHFAVEIARFDGDLLYDVTGAWGTGTTELSAISYQPSARQSALSSQLSARFLPGTWVTNISEDMGNTFRPQIRREVRCRGRRSRPWIFGCNWFVNITRDCSR